jgi:hypothetical protein
LFEGWDLEIYRERIGITSMKWAFWFALQKKSEAAMPTNPNRNNNQQHYDD